MIIILFKIIGLLFVAFIITFILSACKLQKRCQKREEKILNEKGDKDEKNKIYNIN